MKKLTLALIVALAASLAVAQGPGGRPGGPGGPGGGRGRMDPKAQLKKLTEDLKLTPAQVKQVSALVDSRKADMDKLRAAPGEREAKRPQMMKIMQGFNEKLKKILTKEQSAKFDKLQAEMRARFGGGRGGPGGPGGPGKGGPGGPPKAGGK